MLFETEKNEIYICLKHDYKKIWKVSLQNKTIETYLGFTNSKIIELDDSGVLASQLIQIF